MAPGEVGHVRVCVLCQVAPTRRRRPPAWVAPDTVCADYALAAEGFVVLGGPLGAGEEILLIINSASEDAVRTRLGADPWSGSGLLQIARVEPWTVLLDSRSA